MRPHPDARRWTFTQFKESNRFLGPVLSVRGRSQGKRKRDSNIHQDGYHNHRAYMNQNGLVVVTVYGPTGRAWGFSKNQIDRYGMNPDGTTYPWREGTDRRGF